MVHTKREIVVIAHDIRSTHNVGALLRTADGLGIDHVYLTGYTPYPQVKNDSRLPHLAAKITKQIDKTALGAADMVAWSHAPDIAKLIQSLKTDNFRLVGLEQADGAAPLPNYQASQKTALLLGREVEGIDPKLLRQCDTVVEIPMLGKKESLNVVQAAAITLFCLRFM